MLVYILYDVHEEYEHARRRLRELLKDYGGVFLEYSVYVTELDHDQLHSLLRRIRRALRGSAARVDIIIPCAACAARVIRFNVPLEERHIV